MLEEVFLEVNIEKTKFMFLSLLQIAGQNWEIKIAEKSFENMSQFRYLGTGTNQNSIQEGIKSRLNSGNACYHSVQNLVSSLLSKNIENRIYKTTILPLILYGCEDWFLILRREKRNEVTGRWRIMNNEKLGCYAVWLSSYSPP
jgi:hypothetical protein